MLERLQSLACYVGSAAVVAFLAACLDAPRVATFTCDTPPGESAERCVPVQQLASSSSSEPGQAVFALAP